MRYLVTGGAGYIGSHVVLALLDAGHEVVVIDNFITGHRDAIPKDVEQHDVDLLDYHATSNVLAKKRWDGVLHFAALSLVGESIEKPFLYLRNNYQASLNLIQLCSKYAVEKFVFSSTAALFGGPDRCEAISETASIQPASPYGESKYMVECILRWADKIYGLKSTCLRYFNAAGADPFNRAGEDHSPETHLIPLTIDAALGRRPPLQLFGLDYPTPDGTCIRDYVHVTDIAEAHIRALECLNEKSTAFNLGNGRGYSNLEVIQSVERVSGRRVPWEPAMRRLGDPAVLVADSSRIKRETGWSPRFDTLDKIVETAFAWRAKHPYGYDK